MRSKVVRFWVETDEETAARLKAWANERGRSRWRHTEILLRKLSEKWTRKKGSEAR